MEPQAAKSTRVAVRELYAYYLLVALYFFAFGMQFVLFPYLAAFLLEATATGVGLAQSALSAPMFCLLLFGGLVAERARAGIALARLHLLFCGASLALMDAGVPIKRPVAGIAMGLIKEGNDFAVLSDILGDEDHLGDMDFKVAGTETGVTALQMDLKIESINQGIMKIALDQAREARLGILQVMKQGIEGSRTELSSFAPRIIKIKINPDKIRDVIGKGGVVIRGIQEETGTTIEIEDDGTISIACVVAEGGEAARKRILDITADVEVGKIYEGPVLRLLDFGAIVQLMPGRDGLLHISQISHERVNAVSDHLKEGQIVKVKVLEADDKGRVRLSMKAIGAPEAAKQA